MAITVQQMFKKEEPLGPYETPPKLHEINNKKTFLSFYDNHNFLSKQNLVHNPIILLGRRGSGKTALLFHLRYYGGYNISTKLESESVFSDVSNRLIELIRTKSNQDVLVETVSKLWRKVILTSVICQIFGKYKNLNGDEYTNNLRSMRTFLEKCDLVNKRSSKVILGTLVKLAETVSERDLDFVSDFLDNIFENDIGFHDAWEATCEILNRRGEKSIVLIDSLEQFPIDDGSMCEALSGLLHFAGQFDLEYNPVQITLCLPAELHEDFGRISDNFEKDFRKVLSLHWDPVELYQMCGHRFSIFIRENPEVFDRDVKTLINEPTREDVWNFWHQFLPRNMTNRYGRPEDTISYISRHTQLLPRHFLNLLNKISMLSIAGRSFSPSITEDDIIKGVRLGESVICDGVFSGFKQKFPVARDICKLILPKMSNSFRYQQLQTVNKNYGKGLVKDTGELLEQLIRMGVVGKLIKSSEMYDHFRFDYTYNGTMPYSVDDTFGIHPAFSGQFGNGHTNTMKGSTNHRPVYPIESFTGEREGTGALRF